MYPGMMNTSMTGVNGFGGQTIQPTNIVVVPISDENGAINYPVAPNNTVLLMNFNQNRFWLKTQHQNGLSYDLQGFYFMTPEQLQQMTSAQQNNQLQAPQQPAFDPSNFVPRAEFEELKKMIEEFMK